ncbi:hypothetical protein H257_03131 [Aphanomyces astaci]|uniref:Uncharacterized protein n=1 Tax=Aphanomyces astaci TaxID=112090 RepID=W4H2H7_APHAT|nr:hypothetical protein H257_03131 [Aphanomyces astaci]ETV85373.1 hypothetical protein H257_03131 [Aphanomyces astaci]|eukprot:XP_009825391.1 hypothetical protein H257_03131 [Aphanomyces astaci]
MFDGRVNHAEFFQLILPLGMLIGSLVTFNLADRLGRAAMLDLSAIPYVLEINAPHHGQPQTLLSHPQA